MAARDELVAAVAGRYAQGDRGERGRILDEFAAVTGYHRKHGAGPIRSRPSRPSCGPGSRQSRGIHRASYWSDCRLSDPAPTRTGSCGHCSVV